MSTLLLSVLLACGATSEAPAPPAATPAPAAAQAATPAAQVGPVRDIGVDELKTALDGGKVPVLIDVRTPEEFAGGHVPGAKNVPLDQLAGRMGELGDPAACEVYVICQSGGRSARASQSLAAAGRRPVNVQGGTGAWKGAGYPTE